MVLRAEEAMEPEILGLAGKKRRPEAMEEVGPYFLALFPLDLCFPTLGPLYCMLLPQNVGVGVCLGLDPRPLRTTVLRCWLQSLVVVNLGLLLRAR